MKDQIRLLRDCFHNEVPAVVFQGNDSCVGEILEAAKEIYQKHGCSEEFLYDWQMLINEVKALADVCIERRYTAKALAETLSVPLQGEFVNTALVEHLFFSVFKFVCHS